MTEPVSAIMCMCLKYLDDGGPSIAMNLGTGIGYSVLQILSAAERSVGRPIPIEARPRRPRGPAVFDRGTGPRRTQT